MGFMGQKKFGDGRKYFCFQVRFRGLETLGVWKSAKSILRKSHNSLRSNKINFLTLISPEFVAAHFARLNFLNSILLILNREF